jgi:cytochrome c-type biogenesis protein CcmH
VTRGPLILALLAAALLLPGTARAEGAPNASDLEAELVCPTCKTTLDQSDAPVARRMKAYIREKIAAGQTAAEIKAGLVEQFGRGVLAEPPKRGFDLLAWLLPLAGIVIGAAVVGVLAWTWSRRRAPPEDGDAVDTSLDPELERRVDEELARFDG